MAKQNPKQKTWTSPVKAERPDRRVLDEQRDLYVVKSGHERKLLNCIKISPSALLRAARTFRQCVVARLSRVREGKPGGSVCLCECRGGRLPGALNGKNKSAGHVIRSHYLNAFESWGIAVSEGTKQKISQFRKHVWNPAKATRDGETKREEGRTVRDRSCHSGGTLFAYLARSEPRRLSCAAPPHIVVSTRVNVKVRLLSHSFVEMKIIEQQNGR